MASSSGTINPVVRTLIDAIEENNSRDIAIAIMDCNNAKEFIWEEALLKISHLPLNEVVAKSLPPKELAQYIKNRINAAIKSAGLTDELAKCINFLVAKGKYYPLQVVLFTLKSDKNINAEIVNAIADIAAKLLADDKNFATYLQQGLPQNNSYLEQLHEALLVLPYYMPVCLGNPGVIAAIQDNPTSVYLLLVQKIRVLGCLRAEQDLAVGCLLQYMLDEHSPWLKGALYVLEEQYGVNYAVKVITDIGHIVRNNSFLFDKLERSVATIKRYREALQALTPSVEEPVMWLPSAVHHSQPSSAGLYTQPQSAVTITPPHQAPINRLQEPHSAPMC